MKYVLDNKSADVMRISNDAFLYLTQEEEPLDDGNLLEAQQLYEDFPFGFEIVSHKYVEDGLVEVIIVPYIEEPDPVIIKPKVKKKQSATQIKGPTMSEKELTADFFKYWLNKVYAKKPRTLSRPDVVWLENAQTWFENQNMPAETDMVKSLMASY